MPAPRVHPVLARWCVNRKDFQTLALLRLTEARTLLDGGLPDGAYYLAGYVVECALKACIAKRTRRHEFPPEPGKLRDIYTHDLTRLVGAAALSAQQVAEEQLDPTFRAYWSTVKDWSEASRYERHGSREARDMYQAVADPGHGVLQWIRRYW
jgi:hypothetical protein